MPDDLIARLISEGWPAAAVVLLSEVLLRVAGVEARWFALHTIVNATIAIVCLPEMLIFVSDPVQLIKAVPPLSYPPSRSQPSPASAPHFADDHSNGYSN